MAVDEFSPFVPLCESDEQDRPPLKEQVLRPDIDLWDKRLDLLMLRIYKVPTPLRQPDDLAAEHSQV